MKEKELRTNLRKLKLREVCTEQVTVRQRSQDSFHVAFVRKERVQIVSRFSGKKLKL